MIELRVSSRTMNVMSVLVALLWILSGLSALAEGAKVEYFLYRMLEFRSFEGAKLLAMATAMLELLVGAGIAFPLTRRDAGIIGGVLAACMAGVGGVFYANGVGAQCGCLAFLGLTTFGVTNLLLIGLLGLATIGIAVADRHRGGAKAAATMMALALVFVTPRVAAAEDDASGFWDSVTQRESTLRGRTIVYDEVFENQGVPFIMERLALTVDGAGGEIWERLQRNISGDDSRARSFWDGELLPIGSPAFGEDVHSFFVFAESRELVLERRMARGAKGPWSGVRRANEESADRRGGLNVSVLNGEKWFSLLRPDLTVAGTVAVDGDRVWLDFVPVTKPGRRPSVLSVLCRRSWKMLPERVVWLWSEDGVQTGKATHRGIHEGSAGLDPKLLFMESETDAAQEIRPGVFVPSRCTLKYGHAPDILMRVRLAGVSDAGTEVATTRRPPVSIGDDPVSVVDKVTAELEFFGNWDASARESVTRAHAKSQLNLNVAPVDTGRRWRVLAWGALALLGMVVLVVRLFRRRRGRPAG